MCYQTLGVPGLLGFFFWGGGGKKFIKKLHEEELSFFIAFHQFSSGIGLDSYIDTYMKFFQQFNDFMCYHNLSM